MTTNHFATVSTPSAPQMASFPQATKVADLIYTSGQVGINVGTSEREETFRDEVHRAIDHLEAVLEAGGSALSAVVKTTCYLSSMDLYPEFDALYRERFAAPMPGRSTVQCGLARNFRFEIEAIARVIRE
ncbi:RidA family protein [Rhodococcus opacus]|uniref:RidA family protein n=1 Tax=Rhodococcus opacus TaxID=37919 RepID=UPI001C46A758|nr:RidA family protein [Rhodococcus opacus]MBV6760447.1 RidA family protein [Rhodococcus opacus]